MVTVLIGLAIIHPGKIIFLVIGLLDLQSKLLMITLGYGLLPGMQNPRGNLMHLATQMTVVILGI